MREIDKTAGTEIGQNEICICFWWRNFGSVKNDFVIQRNQCAALEIGFVATVYMFQSQGTGKIARFIRQKGNFEIVAFNKIPLPFRIKLTEAKALHTQR